MKIDLVQCNLISIKLLSLYHSVEGDFETPQLYYPVSFLTIFHPSFLTNLDQEFSPMPGLITVL